MDRLTAMSAQNQLLFNLNPAVSLAPLPTRFRPPQPIVIDKFAFVSCFLCLLQFDKLKFVLNLV